MTGGELEKDLFPLMLRGRGYRQWRSAKRAGVEGASPQRSDLLFLRGRCRRQEGSGWRLKVWLKSIRHGRLRERVIEMSMCGMLLLLALEQLD